MSDKDEMLKEAADLADAIAEGHAGHGCGMTGFMREVSGVLRAASTASGPAQVATPTYRSNYETIFGKRVEAGLA